jgi:branched-subunit amino acid transport protein
VSALWTSIAVVAIANFAIKASGPVLLGGRELPEPLVRVIALLASAILSALVVVDTFSDDTNLTVDAQTAGVAAAGAALLLRAPMLAAITVGAVTAALLRALA